MPLPRPLPPSHSSVVVPASHQSPTAHLAAHHGLDDAMNIGDQVPRVQRRPHNVQLLARLCTAERSAQEEVLPQSAVSSSSSLWVAAAPQWSTAVEAAAAAASPRAPILKKSRKLETVESRMEPLTRIVLASSRWSSCRRGGRGRGRGRVGGRSNGGGAGRGWGGPKGEHEGVWSEWAEGGLAPSSAPTWGQSPPPTSRHQHHSTTAAPRTPPHVELRVEQHLRRGEAAVERCAHFVAH